MSLYNKINLNDESEVFVILKTISRLFFFIIVAVYFLMFILSLDGGGRLSTLNILAAIGGNTFWC
ncbi:hypothetical protein FVK30_20520, partial [Escherichia coli]|nr:hypothetical protein [Escherichia coli]